MEKMECQNQFMYHDTYRIVKQISWYVSIRQTVYHPSPGKKNIASLLQLENLLENILRQLITFGILCETDLNYLALILQQKLGRDV
jgi:hypothetical protein